MIRHLGKFLVVLALVFVLSLPFLLRNPGNPTRSAQDTVIIITPHTESIRQEFGRGFERWYEEKTGRSVYVDYRVIGGTSEIGKFLDSEYTNSFRNHWENELVRKWSLEVQEAFNNARIKIDDTPGDDSQAESARRAYLTSNASSGIDVFFGGGAYDLSVQAARGALVDAGLLDKHPDWFQEKAISGTVPPAIPQTLAGEEFFDAEGRWYGAVLSTFGIIYNRDSLRRLGIESEPRQWTDLADPRYFGEIALCDPTKSGSMNQAFEMIIQQQMHESLQSGETLSEGWLRGMQLVQMMSANARYFSDTSQKTNIDVAMGDCAVGMSIDFYGRFQQENIIARGGDKRFVFHTPAGGSSVSTDPIGLLRGAPNREVAVAFMEFVLSLEGQKLWNFKVGSAGGPETYALRRPPIRPELYQKKWNRYRSDADYNPYLASGTFTYRRDWTGSLFSEIRTIIRVCFIDVRKELVEAWAAIIQARGEGRLEDANRAESIMQDLTRVSYHEASTTIDAALKAPRIEEMKLSRGLSLHFRDQYIRARMVAEGN